MATFTSLTIQIVQTVAQVGLAEKIRNGVLDFLITQVKELGKQEISDRIANFRTGGQLRADILTALEQAARRWAESCPDRELVTAVAKNTRFSDIDSVHQAAVQIALHPFDQLPIETLTQRFTEVLPKKFDGVRVKRGIGELFELLREEFASISGLQETQQLAVSIQQLRATQIAAEHIARLENIERILVHLENGPSPNDDTLYRYLTWVINQNRYLDPRGTMQTVRQVQVKLDEVYVSLMAEPEPPLSGVDRRIYEGETESLMAREDLSFEDKENLRENLLTQMLEKSETATTGGKTRELDELTLSESKLVILGDPGSGKTTLLRYLAYQYAQSMRSHLDNRSDHWEPSLSTSSGSETSFFSVPVPLLPLYIRIAEYAEYGQGRSLIEFLPHNVCGDISNYSALPRLIEDRLKAGSCLILLDGLDEVIDLSQRGEIAAQINSLVRAFDQCGNHFVITSRVAGYRSAMLAGEIPHYRIQDMNEDQIQRFLQQWCTAVERFQTPDLPKMLIMERAQREINEIRRSISQNAGVRRLANNPLLLRTLALIHRTGSHLPARRIDLYRLAADTLIRDWELARGIPERALVQEAEATPLLAELAAWLHDEKPAGIATRGEVRRKLAEIKGNLDDRDPDHPDVLKAVDNFLERIRQHTGLFVERAPNRYGFMHLTFEEYFSARYLVAKPRKASLRIRNKLHNSRWREPILLAIGFYGTEFPSDVDELVQEAILGDNLGGPSPYEGILHRDLLFAIRCMGDQDLGNRLRDKLIWEFVKVWHDEEKGASKYIILKEEMVKIIQEIQESQAGKKLLDEFILHIQNDDTKVQIMTIQAIGFVPANEKSTAVLLSALKSINSNVRASAALALANATGREDVVSALLITLQHDEDGNARANAARALEKATQRDEVVSALLNALKDEDWNVRTGAAHALANAANQVDVVTYLLHALQEERANVRASAALALVNATSQSDVVSSLLKSLQEERANIRASAAQTLAFASNQIMVMRALLNALCDENADVRASAAEALANATSKVEVVSGLLHTLMDENPFVRGIAADALRNATFVKEDVGILLHALQDENWFVRARAAEALSSATNQPEVLEALLQKLHDEDGNVRGSSAEALANVVDNEKVVSALLILLLDEDVSVRASAARALAKATYEQKVISALLSALQDRFESVQNSAAMALYTGSNQTKTANLLLPYLEVLNEMVISSKPLSRVIILFKDPDEYRAPYDYLYQILRTLAPGPCRR